MAVYNGEQYIKPSIESVLAQSFSNYEFIIVNDACTDSTLNVISSYNDPRIVVHHNHENMGQTASLNVGLRMARGKYIARTDAGDISVPERFLKQVQYLDNHAVVDILGTAAFQYDMAGKFCGNVFMSNRPSTILQRIFFACPVIHISVMMRRERIIQLGGYDESYRILADYGLWAKALQNGFKFWNLEEILAGYLVTPDSFGYSHGRGRSVAEAACIISEVVQNMTGIKLTFNQAEIIYRFFVFSPQDLEKEQSRKAEMLFESILLKLNTPQRDIDYLLLRNYLKMFTLKQPGISSQKPVLKEAFNGILRKCRGGLSYHMLEDLRRGVQSLRYRKYSAAAIDYYPNFNFNAADDVK